MDVVASQRSTAASQTGEVHLLSASSFGEATNRWRALPGCQGASRTALTGRGRGLHAATLNLRCGFGAESRT